MADRPRPRRSFWRTSRTVFRWLRISALLLVLALIGALFYLHRVGLPDFLKGRLLDELRARGVELQFTRMRLAWSGGVVAEQVLFGGGEREQGPQMFAETVELHPDYKSLKHLKLESVGRLVVRGGHFTWKFAATNLPPRALAVDRIRAEIHFLPDDTWQINQLQATYAGANLRVNGTLTNASALRQPQPATAEHPGPGMRPLDESVRQLVDTFEQIKFAVPPELNLIFTGDARDVQTFQAFLTLRAPSADSPWGSARNIALNARLTPAVAIGRLPLAKLDLKAASAKTKWASTRDLDLSLNFAGVGSQTNSFRAELELRAGATTTEWCQAASAQGAFRWRQSLTNPIPTEASADVRLTRARSKWANVESAHAVARYWPATGSGATRGADGDAWWASFEPHEATCHLELGGVEAQKLSAQEVVCDAAWRAPELSVTNLTARLLGGQLDAQLALDVASRAARVHAKTDFEPHRLRDVLPESVNQRLDEFAWDKPPRLDARAVAVLPPWTNRPPDWRTEVLPTLDLNARVECGPVAFRGFQVDSVRARAAYSNSCLAVPELHVTRPEGGVKLSGVLDTRSEQAYVRVSSSIDPQALLPLLDDKARRAFNLLKLTQPPRLEAEVWTALGDVLSSGILAGVAVTNLSFRGESVAECRAALRFTNQVLEVYEPEVVRTDGVVRAGLVRVDFPADTVTLTNGFCTVEPMAVMRAIGPNPVKVTAPYRFLKPPAARVNGVAPMHGTEGFDLHVSLNGGPFQWSLFHLDHVSGAVHYVSNTVQIAGVQADGYSGRIVGDAEVALTREPGEQVKFNLTATDADLRQLMHDVTERTNHLEGTFSGQLIVTSANTADWETWQGYGSVALRDGLVWEWPMFGVLSPFLNSVVPGLGHSRFSRGVGTFTITNSVVYSSDVELRAPLMRLKCRGTADFHERVNARMEAEPLRNMWVIGPILSAALWPVSKALEYKITGTLGDPKAEPLHAPAKVLLFPLQPITTLKDIFGNDANRTNAPPR